MEELSAYLPIDRLRALATGIVIPDRVQGTALLADLSGFTSLTEALVDELGAQRGAEEVAHYLNEVYDALIQELKHFNGSVISFAGDAIICWFDGDDGLRASACALAMQQTMKQFTAITLPSSKKDSTLKIVSLAVKASVAAGTARRFVVGDPSIQRIDALAGSTLERLEMISHYPERGEVVLDTATLAALGSQPRIVRWHKNHVTGEPFGVVGSLAADVAPAEDAPLLVDKALDAKLKPWLLPPVLARIESGRGDFLAEMRPTVALFLRFSGIDFDNDDQAGDKLDAFICWVQNILLRYEGYLLQLNVGDKGSTLYAVFGAPIAHENDATRAVNAAFELITPPQTLSFINKIQIGMSQGQCFSGAYGGTLRRTYGILGDDVNLAARLMQTASSGEILVSQTIRQAAGRAFHWEPLPPLRVKGKKADVIIFRLLGFQPRRTFRLQASDYSLPIVGRKTELELCHSKIAEALNNKGQVIGVVGEPGIGKTRLVAEIIRYAEERRLASYGGECESYGTDIGYLVWQPVWRGLFDLDLSMSLDDQAKSLQEKLASIDSALVTRLPLLGSVLNLPIPDNELTSSLDPKLRKTSLETLLVECLEAFAREKTLLLVLEDCQWLDALSHDLLEVFGRSITRLPVAIIVTYRPSDPLRLQEMRVSKLSNFTEVRLHEFSQQEADELIRLKVKPVSQGLQSLPERVVEQIIARTEGNPFYIDELINYLNDRKIDLQDSDSLATVDLPNSLHSLVLSRIDQLNENEKITLKVASVIGRLFQVAFLWGMYPEIGDPERVKSIFETMSQLQLTVRDTTAPELSYFFKQIIIQEVAYDNLPFAMRTLLHEQLARFIEQTYQETLDQQLELLAYHYLRGQAWEKALRYNLQAAHQAKRKYDNEAAIANYHRALDCAARLGYVALTNKDRLSAHESLGEVLTLVGRYDEALGHYTTSRNLVENQYGTSQTRRHLADLCRKTAEIYERRSAYETSLEWLRKGLNILDPDQPTIEAARIHLLGTGVYFRQGKYEEALTWCQKSLDVAILIQSREGRQAEAHMHQLLGLIQYRLGDLHQAIAQGEQSLQIYQEIEDILGQAKVLNNIAMAYSDQGKWVSASAAFDQSLKINRQIGNIFELGAIANNLADIYRDQGDLEQATTLYQQSNAVWKQLGAGLFDAVTQSNLGQVCIYQERWHEARSYLEHSQQLFAEAGSEDFLSELERRWGEYYLHTADLGQAVEHTRRSLELAVAQEARLDEGMAYRVLGEILAARREFTDAEQALDQSLRIFKELDSEFEAAKTAISHTQLAKLRADSSPLRSDFLSAVQTFERLGAQRDLIRAKALQE